MNESCPIDYRTVPEILSILQNRPIREVRVPNDGSEIIFTFEDLTRGVFVVEGDCCSTSWIEHISLPQDIQGATIVGIRLFGDSGYGFVSESENVPPCGGHHTTCAEADVLKAYQVIFDTTAGEIVVEFRNDSNGYYGGELVLLPRERN